MAESTFDLVVLGAGPAGERGAAQAAYFGKRVAIVEREADPGGAAVHTGTLPSKTLRETALFLSGYRQRDLYGVSVEVSPDLAVSKLLEREHAVRELETERIRRNLERHGVELIPGTARFLDAGVVEVSDGDRRRTLRGQVVLITCGSHPFHPPGVPYEDPDVHDSTSILQIDRLPRSLAVLGGGVIGCEFASMFAALGVQVELVDSGTHLLPLLDLEIGKRLREAMGSLGVRFHMESRAGGVRRTEHGLLTTLSSGEQLVSEKVLVAAGRRGNTADLDLHNAGVDVDERGYVVVDGDYRTSVPGIYAAGDIIGFPLLASTSMEQGRVAVCHAFGFTYKRHVSDLLPYGVYTIPEVSCVGLSEQEAERRGLAAVVGRAAFRDNVRGQIVGDRDGFVKLVFDPDTRKLIGAHCIGERASELVLVGQAVITLGGTAETFIEMVVNHPTLGETYKYAAYDALGKMAPVDGSRRAP